MKAVLFSASAHAAQGQAGIPAGIAFSCRVSRSATRPAGRRTGRQGLRTVLARRAGDLPSIQLAEG